MATATLQKISKNHLECSICQERFKEPKILACLHSFCAKCLEDYHTRFFSTNIACPLCRQETILPQGGVSALKTNFFITSLIEDIALQEQVGDVSHVPMCDICGNNSAVHRCLDCSKNICEGCLQWHKQFPDLLGHTVATLEDIRQGRVVAKTSKRGGQSECGKHPGEIRRFFCERCEELICRDCTVIDHPNTLGGHHCVDLNTASTKLRKTLTDYLQELNQKEANLIDAYKVAQKTEQELKNNTKRVSQQIQAEAAKFIEHITKEKDQILKEVENITEIGNKTLNQSKNSAATKMQRVKHSKELVQDITEKASDSDFLSLFPEIKRDFQTLRRLDVPRVDKQLSVLNVQTRKTSDIKNLWVIYQGASHGYTTGGKSNTTGGNMAYGCVYGRDQFTTRGKSKITGGKMAYSWGYGQDRYAASGD